MESTEPTTPAAETRTILRGRQTGFRLFVACVLGALLGFAPGFINFADPVGGFGLAPALVLGLLAVAVVLKSSLIVLSITLAWTKLAAVLLGGLSFAIGEFLLEGPTSGLFRAMINAPVLAWCGFEHYTTTGGLFLGLVVGILWFFLLRRLLRTEVSAEEARARKLGSPVRLVGIAVVLVVVGGLWLLQSAVGGAALKDAFRQGLQQGNGATVDIADFNLDLGKGEIVVGGLAMADQSDPKVDLFRAQKLELKIGTAALLRRRMVIDSIEAVAASSGETRETPGEVFPGENPPPPPPEPGEKSLEDYLNEAKAWEARLRQASQWLESMFRTPTENEEERQRRIEAEKAEAGDRIDFLTADHLITGSPSLLVRSVNIASIRLPGEKGDTFDIVASNLSTNPALVDEPAKIGIQSKQNRFGIDLALANKATDVRTSFFYTGIAVDTIAQQLGSSVQKTLSGGTLGISLKGNLAFRDGGTWIDLPLKLAFKDTTLTVKGTSPAKLDQLEIPLGLRGPLSSPRIKFDDTAFADALLAAGKAELANQVRKQAGKLLGDKVPDKVKGAVDDVLSGKGTDAAKQAIEEAKKKAAEDAKKRATDELKKRLPGGLFGTKKKDEGDKKK